MSDLDRQCAVHDWNESVILIVLNLITVCMYAFMHICMYLHSIMIWSECQRNGGKQAKPGVTSDFSLIERILRLKSSHFIGLRLKASFWSKLHLRHRFILNLESVSSSQIYQKFWDFDSWSVSVRIRFRIRVRLELVGDLVVMSVMSPHFFGLFLPVAYTLGDSEVNGWFRFLKYIVPFLNFTVSIFEP